MAFPVDVHDTVPLKLRHHPRRGGAGQFRIGSRSVHGSDVQSRWKEEASMQTRDIAYTAGETDLKGYFAAPDGAVRRPGILVCHQGGGITEHTKERTRMLAEIGYAAFALDMYGIVVTKVEEAMPLMQALVQNPPEMRKRAQAGLKILMAQPEVDTGRLAAIGFCFGGALVLELARFARELSCVVAFHPGMAPPVPLAESDDRKIACKVMVCAGADDPFVPPSAREKFAELMKAAGADWQLLIYGGAGHSFTDRSVDALNLPGFKYHSPTDHRSWAAMRNLFDEVLGA
jgi:dienelactone hydrolase